MQKQYAIHPRLRPKGFSVVQSAQFAFFRLTTPIESATGLLIFEPLPSAIEDSPELSERYLQGLLREVEFLTRRGSTVIPAIHPQMPVAEAHRIFCEERAGHVGIRNIAQIGGEISCHRLCCAFSALPSVQCIPKSGSPLCRCEPRFVRRTAYNRTVCCSVSGDPEPGNKEQGIWRCPWR